MSGDRAAILGALKSALERPGRDAEAPARRISARRANLIPGRGAGGREARLARFAKEAAAASATVTRLASERDLPAEIARYLSALNLPAEIRAAPSLRDVPWDRQPTLSVNVGPAAASDAVGVSRAFAGVAETGTLAFRSGPENPTTLNFLPPTHIAVLSAADLHGDYEAVWTKLRGARQAPAPMPRAVNLVTGPSCTGDIEQTLQHGAHGPQNLHIIVINDDEEHGPQ